MEEDKGIVKKVLKNLFEYLRENLPVDQELAGKLYGWKPPLIQDGQHRAIRAFIDRGRSYDAFQEWYDFATANYEEESLNHFIDCLKKTGKDARPKLKKIAIKIEKEIKRVKKSWSDSDTRDQGNKVKSQTGLTKPKVKEIVHWYREGKDVSLPSNPKLEKKYDDILSSVKNSLQSAEPSVISRIHHKVCSTYNRLVHGVRPVPLPRVDETGQSLYVFIAEKSTFYEVFLVEEAISELNNEKLNEAFFTKYKPELSDFLKEKLTSCQQNNVSLPRRADHVHMAVMTSDEVLLSLMLHLKAYFIAYLELEECLFEGFHNGCLVLYFAITATVAFVVLASKILSHLDELKRRFSITHIVVFDHFAVDIDQGSVELLPKQARKEVPEKLLGLCNGGNLVQENKWDQLKSAICSIRCEEKSTGFVVKVDGCLYLLTTLHSFPTGQEKMTHRDRRRQIKEVAKQAKYRFFYTERWEDERATEEEIKGEDIVNQSNQASVKFDQVLDVVAVPLVDDFEECVKSESPKITPISLDELDKLRVESWCDYYITVIGHPYGMPLSRSIAAITDMKDKSIGYDCDTDYGSSGSPVVIATDQNKLMVVGVHRGGGGPDSKLNYAALLLPFIQGQF